MSMRLCHREEVVARMSSGELVAVRRSGHPIEFVDEFRVGLHLRGIGEVLGPVSAARPGECEVRRLNLESCRLEAGKFYLAVTDECFVWPMDMLASIHTRSTYARIGLEFLGSSDIVVPGYGSSAAAPLALEIRPAVDVCDLSPDVAYSFLLAYALDRKRTMKPAARYADKFPFDALGG